MGGTTVRSIESLDRAIENLEAFVARMVRHRPARLPGAEAMSRTYRAERLIAVLREQRAAIEAGDRRRVDDLEREFATLRSQARPVRAALDR